MTERSNLLPEPHGLIEIAHDASNLLKALANADRLMILGLLAHGEKSVTELGEILKLRQPTLSQQLARLRADRLVKTRRDAKYIFYSLASEEAERVMILLHELFAEPVGVPTSTNGYAREDCYESSD